MHQIAFHPLRFGLFFFAALLAFANVTEAGPPLLCHPFEIGGAKSLPWDKSENWNSPQAGYDIANVVPETMSLLSSETGVIIRMETLRRAAIYSVKDQRIAFELLSRLMARALDAEANEKPEALAWFDAGYLVETYKQAKWTHEKQSSWLSKQNLIEGMNGYAWVLKGIQLGGDAPAMEFAASLMKEGSFPNEHFRRAVAAATDGSLLARNLVHFGDQAKNFAALRAKYGKTKN